MNSIHPNRKVKDFISDEKSRVEQELERVLNIFNSKCRDICRVQGIKMSIDQAHPTNVKCEISYKLYD